MFFFLGYKKAFTLLRPGDFNSPLHIKIKRNSFYFLPNTTKHTSAHPHHTRLVLISFDYVLCLCYYIVLVLFQNCVPINIVTDASMYSTMQGKI